ncbi:MAG: tetratricopeptide repeat protein [Phycisphaerae bacterium]|nr:tetratricopeptide repeat protein [Phycisphaerae bacterium]MCZ2398754.1 tetratricopeptide repeat protein [Phycisphaerae bacterium]
MARTWRRTHVAWLALVLAGWPALAARAAQDERQREIERLVADGDVTALSARLGGRTPENLHLLARAQANRASAAREPLQRQRAFEDAERRYNELITAYENAPDDPTLRLVNAAAARIELALMCMTRWATPDLDEFEISNGERGDRARLLRLLSRARGLCESAALTIRPLADELETGDREVEDRFLALGIYDQVRALNLDVDFNLGWANLSIARVQAGSEENRADALRVAERCFRRLLDAGSIGANVQLVFLGLGMTLREQQRYAEAERCFGRALDDADFPMEARTRYEHARSQLAAGQFDEARLTLRRLIELDVADLGPTQQAARFYMNLARLWEANSFLVEADRLSQTAETSTARRAVLLRAQRARETGLTKLTRLAAEGGFWPGVVDLYISASVPAGADPATLSPIELLFTARRLAAEKRFDTAVERLTEAIGRPDLSRDLSGDLLYELGLCQYWRGSKREAAAVFDRLATEQKNHARAVAAVTYASQLWAELAEDSRQPDDYARLSDTLLNLLQSFPEHPQRHLAEWWLPMALQSAGRYEQASERFAAVRADSPQWEEAQYRRVHCQRLLLESQRTRYSPLDYAQRAQLAVTELRRYARSANERAVASPRAQSVRHWAALAEVSAAELLVSAGVEQYQQALDVLADFEQRYSGVTISRALAARVRAYRGLKQFDAGSRALEEYLRSVPAEKVGPLLANLAAGMQEEVERLADAGQSDEAALLATDAIPTFQQLEAWAVATNRQPAEIATIRAGLARMHHVARRLKEGLELVLSLLSEEPRNGNYLRLAALLRTDMLPERPSAAELAAAREAWETLLRDSDLRVRAPSRYWEARYHHLELLLREGRAEDVAKAIASERVWYPEMGGARWQQRFENLQRLAAAQAGLGPVVAPVTHSRPAD